MASPAAQAQWTNDPWNGMVSVCSDSGEQAHLRTCRLGTNTTIAVWGDERDGEIPRLYFQILNSQGIPQMQANGLPVIDGNWITAWGNIASSLISDGEGGCIAVFEDHRNGSYHNIYGQRIDSLGNRLWGPTGQPLVIWAGGNTGLKDVTSDSLGNGFFAWSKNLFPTNEIYLQKFDLISGERLWGELGVMDCGGQALCDYQEIVADGRGGVIDVWMDNRPGGFDYYLYGQHMNAAGHPLWTRNGVQLIDPHGGGAMWVAGLAEGVPDGSGGGVWAFHSAMYLLEMRRFRLADPGRILWSGVSQTSNSYDIEGMLRHPGDGMIWLWTLENHGTPDKFFFHLYRLNTLTGEQLLGPRGIALGWVDAYPSTFTCVTPTSGGVIVFLAYDLHQISHVTARRVTNSGTIRWTSEVALAGPPVQNAQDFETPKSTSDGVDGAVCAFVDNRDFSQTQENISAQRVQWNGQLGNPPPAAQSQPGHQVGGLSEFAGIIRYVLPQPGEVQLELFDLLGRRVALLEQGYRPAGEQMTRLNRQDYASGIYWLRLTTTGQQQMLKVVMVR
jgi:hypothetical protein